MHIQTDTTGSPAVLAKLIAQCTAQPDIGLVLVLACEDNGFQQADLDPVLQACAKPLIGGVFPQIVRDANHLSLGTIVAGIPCRAKVTTVTELSVRPEAMEAVINEDPPVFDEDSGTLLVFVDGRSSGIGRLIDAIFNRYGLSVNYVGGGTGSLTVSESHSVLSNQGMLIDAAVMAVTDITSSIGVAHGWTAIAGPFKVTESQRNTIISLDWKPAFEVYRSVVEKHGNARFSDSNFFDLAKAYPFGIAKLDSEMVVRDPLLMDGDTLVCVGEVPRDAYVYILNGNAQTLIHAAGQALAAARDAFPPTAEPRTVLFIDCISRVLFLEQQFTEELVAVSCGRPLIGALSLGERACSGGDFLEFLNKTSVVGLFAV